jgi:hypothetical protein
VKEKTEEVTLGWRMSYKRLKRRSDRLSDLRFQIYLVTIALRRHQIRSDAERAERGDDK